MYLLLLLLGTETELLKVQLTFLKESSHIRRQREWSRRVTSRLFAAWDRLAAILNKAKLESTPTATCG